MSQLSGLQGIVKVCEDCEDCKGFEDCEKCGDLKGLWGLKSIVVKSVGIVKIGKRIVMQCWVDRVLRRCRRLALAITP